VSAHPDGLVSYTCPNCGATQTFNPALRSLSCAFCGTQLVVKDEPPPTIAGDRFIVPFALDLAQAHAILDGWLQLRGHFDLAPHDVLHTAQFDEGIGTYVPFWHFTCTLLSNWTGRYGQTQFRTDIVTTGKRGRRSVQARPVPYTVWFPTGGQHVGEHGALVLASYGVSPAEADGLGPYPLEHVEPDRAEYHLGFITEEPACTAETAWAWGDYLIRTQESEACGQMTQVLDTVNATIQQCYVSLIWMPLWLFGYRYKGSRFRIVVEGCTGRLSGDRPTIRDRFRRR
jgi:hypothetical protein